MAKKTGLMYPDQEPVEKLTREEIIDWLTTYYVEGLEDSTNEDLRELYREKSWEPDGDVLIVEAVAS